MISRHNFYYGPLLMGARSGVTKDMNVLIYSYKRADKGAGGGLNARGGAGSINPLTLRKIIYKRRNR